MVWALSADISESVFWGLNPATIKPYMEAHKKKINHQNYLAWLQGLYCNVATSVALSNGFSKNSRAEYPREPIQIFELTEREKQEKALLAEKQFIAELKSMQQAFNARNGID